VWKQSENAVQELASKQRSALARASSVREASARHASADPPHSSLFWRQRITTGDQSTMAARVLAGGGARMTAGAAT
jgi:hypothetical protein